MRELIKQGSGRAASSSLPVKALDAFERDINKLLPGSLLKAVDDVLFYCRPDHDPHRDGHRPRELSLPPLPAKPSNMLAELQAKMRPATASEIAHCLAIIDGLYGSRGDGNVIASVGVDLIEAEGASYVALYAATVGLLRPTPAEYEQIVLGGYGTGEYELKVPSKARKFTPTPSEFILELRSQQSSWERRLIELESRILKHMRESGRWVASEAREKVLDLDPVLARKVDHPTKGKTPR